MSVTEAQRWAVPGNRRRHQHRAIDPQDRALHRAMIETGTSAAILFGLTVALLLQRYLGLF